MTDGRSFSWREEIQKAYDEMNGSLGPATGDDELTPDQAKQLTDLHAWTRVLVAGLNVHAESNAVLGLPEGSQTSAHQRLTALAYSALGVGDTDDDAAIDRAEDGRRLSMVDVVLEAVEGLEISGGSVDVEALAEALRPVVRQEVQRVLAEAATAELGALSG
jgi:hypothetical protein